MVIHQSIQKSKHKSLAEFEVDPLVIYSIQKMMMNQHVLKHINFYLECDKVFLKLNLWRICILEQEKK